MRIALYAGLALAALATPAAADIKTACKKDVETLCKSVKAGGGKLMNCVAENRAKVSNDCKLAIAERYLERRAKAAKDDDD